MTNYTFWMILSLMPCIITGFGQVVQPVVTGPDHHTIDTAVAGKEGPVSAGIPASGWLADSAWYSPWNVNTQSWDLYQRNFIEYTGTGAPSVSLFLVRNLQTSGWENSNRTVYAYGISGNTISVSGQTWDNSAALWIETMRSHYDDMGRMDTSWNKVYDPVTHHFFSGSRSVYTYNSSNLTTEYLGQVLDTATGNWKNSSRLQYTYTPSNQVNTQIAQLWDNPSQSWINNQQYEYYFDGSGFATGYLFSVWDIPGSQWNPDKKATFTNNASGMPVEKLFQKWSPSAGTWTNEEKITYQYNAVYQVTDALDLLWNSSSSSWVNNWKEQHTYYSNNMQKNNYQWYWNPGGSFWMDTWYSFFDSLGYYMENYSKYLDFSTYNYTGGYRYLYSYLPDHKMSGYEQFHLVPGFNNWEPAAKREYTYDANGNNTVILDLTYNSGPGSYVNAYKIEYFYSFFTGIPAWRDDPSTCLFTNPLRKGQQVRCPGTAGETALRMDLFSASGTLVFHSRTDPSGMVSLPQNMASGLYIIRISWQGKVICSGKVILED